LTIKKNDKGNKINQIKQPFDFATATFDDVEDDDDEAVVAFVDDDDAEEPATLALFVVDNATQTTTINCCCFFVPKTIHKYLATVPAVVDTNDTILCSTQTHIHTHTHTTTSELQFRSSIQLTIQRNLRATIPVDERQRL
jgi:hypothetical protein